MNQKHYLKLFALMFVLLAWASPRVYALGTPACTDITNTATINYTIGAVNASTVSNTTTNKVAEVIDLTVSWTDTAAITVTPNAQDQITTFSLTNTGNATESFSLSVLSTLTTSELTPANDHFNPSSPIVRLDGNNNGTYEPGSDPLYVPGTNDPTLGANKTVYIFILADIPTTNHTGGSLVDGDLGDVRLTATSKTPDTGNGTDPGDVSTGNGPCPGPGPGNNAVFGQNGNDEFADGRYVISSVIITAIKSFVVSHPDFPGLTTPIPGSEIAYTITVTATGSGTATNVVFSDPIPANTTYKLNTLKYNDGNGEDPMTDIFDHPAVDPADVNGTTTGFVTVYIGSMAAGSPQQHVKFTVKIN